MPKKAKKKTSDPKVSTYAGQSGSTDAGKSTNPLEPPAEGVGQSPSITTSIPIGIPISAQDFRTLKERAGKAKTSDKGNAQEDPAAA